VPLMVMVAGAVLLGLLLVRVGLEVATALLYVLGGLVLGLSVTGFGRRLLSAWLVAAGAILVLPLLWSTVFVTGAALMLDAGATGGRGGFASFVAQLYNVAAALAVFWIAIKLALGVFRHASGAITGITSTPAAAGPAGGRGGGTGRLQALAQNATPAGLARFSRSLRGQLAAGASYPRRHPVRVAQAASYPLRRPVQATREAASGLADAITATAGRGASAGARVADSYRRERDGGRFSAHAADLPANADQRNGAPDGDGTRSQPPAQTSTENRAGAARASGSSGQAPRAPATAPPLQPSAVRGSTSAEPPTRDDVTPPPPPGTASGPGRSAATPPPEGAPGAGTTRPLWLPRPPRSKRDDRDRKEKQ
jgi:hypothetical protein